MTMLDYRCPLCARLLMRADGHVPMRVEIKCRACKLAVQPVHRSAPLHRTYECSRCERRQHVERPRWDRTFCIACGTTTLRAVAETEARTPTRANRQTRQAQTAEV